VGGDLLRTLPDHVLHTKVFTYFGFKDYALTSCASHYLQTQWQLANLPKKLPLYVPEDCRTLGEAVRRVEHDHRITTIVLGEGEHQINGNNVEISSATTILGNPKVAKEKILVMGGICFMNGIQGTCHLQHLTLRQAKRTGVIGKSSFTMEDVLVEQCGNYGVAASGTGGVGTCTNVEVRRCGGSGVLASRGASMTLIGAKTTVHHNCTKEENRDYGLQVFGSLASTIQLVSPLTKEQVSTDNGGGGNWYAAWGAYINQIKTIDASPVPAAAAPAGETKTNHSSPRRDDLSRLPGHVLTAKVLTLLGFKDYALTSCTCNYLQAHWQTANQKTPLPLYVPEDCRTVKEAVKRVHEDDRLTTIVLGKGEHVVAVYKDKYGDEMNDLDIPSAMNIVGRPAIPKDKIVVVGGIYFNGEIQGNCHLRHLTLRRSKGCGVYGASSFTMEDVLVEQSEWHGVSVDGTGVAGRLTNVEVRQSGWSGVVAESGASITLIGAKTKVHHNGTTGRRYYYGLEVAGSHECSFSPFTNEPVFAAPGSSNPSTIQLVSPLTKEHVSTANGGGGNWGADGGDISQIKTIAATTFSSVPCGETKVHHPGSSRTDDLLRLPDHVLTAKVVTYFGFKDYALTSCASHYLQAHWTAAHRQKPLPLYVPEDCHTLEEAVKRVGQDSRITTIVLGKGEHQINGDFLDIVSTMHIVGRPDIPKEKIVVVGGVFFKKEIQGNCHLQHLTLRHAKKSAVVGCASFTMEDVIVEGCGNYGVLAEGPRGIGRCTHVEVRECGWSGMVAAHGGSITLVGAKTTVHHNCTAGFNHEYGLKISYSSSTIRLVAPLTKELVSVDNGGGGNWAARYGGDIHQLKTIDEAPAVSSVSVSVGETKSNQ